jgi:hypothetical protein
MNAAESVATAVIFMWLGMVLAISFLEAPVKFRAPGVTLQIGLGIGRLVFRLLNTAELALASIVLVAIIVGGPPTWILDSATTATALLVVQVAGVRPRLTRRSNAVLAGANVPRSKSHYAYIALEAIKVLVLLDAGIGLLTLSR